MPDIIADNLQSIIVLVVVVVALARKILEGINANQPSQLPPPGEILDDDAEPGELSRHRVPTVPPPFRRGMIAPAGDMNEELARQRAMEERIRKIRDAKLKAQAASGPVHQVPVAHRQAPISHGLNRRLHSTKELRQTFILKEILDRPVGLR